MSAFTDSLSVRFVKGGRLTELVAPLVWECDEKGSGHIVIVPAGFQSDGTTVPRLLWPIVPPYGHLGVRAAFLHDYGIELVKSGTPHRFMPTRHEVDRQFHLALLACGVRPWLARMMYLAVSARTRGLV